MSQEYSVKGKFVFAAATLNFGVAAASFRERSVALEWRPPMLNIQLFRNENE